MVRSGSEVLVLGAALLISFFGAAVPWVFFTWDTVIGADAVASLPVLPE